MYFTYFQRLISYIKIFKGKTGSGWDILTVKFAWCLRYTKSDFLIITLGQHLSTQLHPDSLYLPYCHMNSACFLKIEPGDLTFAPFMKSVVSLNMLISSIFLDFHDIPAR